MLPSPINIGGRTFVIKERARIKEWGKEYLGLHKVDKQEILILKTFPEESTKAKTFLHELIHGLNTHFNYLSDDFDKEEELTTIMANGLNMLFKDNPKLVEYLYEVYCK